MKFKILIAVTTILAVGAFIATYLVIDASNTNKELISEQENLTEDIETADEELPDFQKMAESLGEERKTLDDERISLIVELDDLLDENEELSSTLSSLQKNYGELLDSTICPTDEFGEVEFSYESNESMSDELADYGEELWGKVSEADWFAWDDFSETALHTLEIGSDVEFFLVFFDNKSASTVNGVFYINEKCWLNLPSLEEELGFLGVTARL